MEVETKVKIDDLEKIKFKLEKLGAKFFPTVEQIDEYYKPKGKEMETQRPGSFIIRIRIQGDKNFLTLKQLTERTGVWVEHETEVENSKETRHILEKSGFSRIFTITKKRTHGDLNGFELCLDDIKELGKYLEISLISEDGKEAKERINELMKKIDVEEKNVEHRGYAAIISQNMGVKFEGTNG